VPNLSSLRENLQKYLKKLLNMEKNTLFSIFTIGIRKIIPDDSLLSLGSALGVRYPPSLKKRTQNPQNIYERIDIQRLSKTY
jgi:hypothetical protein